MNKEQQLLISIIVPAYNVENYISSTLESICRNNLESTEIIIIDDGSTDSTRARIESCLNRLNPPHFKFISQVNMGVSVARNVGIDNSTGQYLIFCDGDDKCYPDMIEEITPILEKRSDLIVWGFDITQNNNRTIGQGEFGVDLLREREVFKYFLLGKYRIRLGSFAIKKSFLEETQIRYTEGCPLSQDVEFIYKCLSKVKDAEFVDKILFTYAKREGSVMYTYNLNRFEAPRAMKRVYEFVEKNTNIMDDELKDYLQNGFLVQHSIFAFDACIRYLTDNKSRKEFLHSYYDKYADVESELKRACKEMKKYPIVTDERKVKLFSLSRSLYVMALTMRMNCRKRKCE